VINRDLTHLYPATTIKFMEEAKHLCLLPYSRPQYRVIGHVDNDLPTWCPVWSFWGEWKDYFDIHNNGDFTADGRRPYNGSRQGNTILKLEGILLDTLEVVGPLIPDMNVPPGDFVPIMQEWLNLAESRDLGPEVIWECMHVATHVEVGLDKVDLQAAYWEDLKRLASEDASIQDMKAAVIEGDHQFCFESGAWLDKRSFFATKPSESFPEVTSEEGPAHGISGYRSKMPKGSVGMALPNVRAGDVVFIIKGGRTPLLFRPLSGERLLERALEEGVPENKLSRCYTLVGVSYIHGLMQGQGVTDSSSWEDVYLL